MYELYGQLHLTHVEHKSCSAESKDKAGCNFTHAGDSSNNRVVHLQYVTEQTNTNHRSFKVNILSEQVKK